MGKERRKKRSSEVLEEIRREIEEEQGEGKKVFYRDESKENVRKGNKDKGIGRKQERSGKIGGASADRNVRR